MQSLANLAIDPEYLYIVNLLSVKGFGNQKALKLVKKFGTVKDLYSDFEKADLDSTLKDNLRDSMFIDQKILEKLIKSNVQLLAIDSDNYPKELSLIKDPPVLLFCRGNIKLLDENLISIVGTRKMTEYGKFCIHNIIKTIKPYNYVTVSGLAFGVDLEVHKESLKEGLPTISVLPNTVLYAVPKTNERIFNKILQNGLAISEFLESDIHLGAFPRRNRIVAALCNSNIIVEAPKDSGSLITANFAKKFGKTVWAIPGDITRSSSEGTNWLIKESLAKSLNSFHELLEDTTDKNITVNIDKLANFEPEVKDMLTCIKKAPLNLDELSEILGKNVGDLSLIFTNLELEGIVVRDYFGKYRLNL